MKIGFHRFASANFLLLSAAAVLLMTVSSPHRAAGADRTWNGAGGDNNWSTPANWGGVAPAAGDALFFGGSVRTSPFNDFPAGTVFNGITINNPSGLFTLRGGRIVLGGNLADLMPLVPQTNLLALSLTGIRTVDVVADGLLTLAGEISGAGAGLIKTGGGQTTLGGANTFSSSVAILGGTLAIASDANLGAVPAGPTAGRITIDGGALRSTANLTLNANRGIALGSSTGSGSGTFTVNSGTTLTYGGVLANNGGGVGGLTKNGFGGLTIFGANTYTGPTVIQNGTVTLEFTQTGAPANNIISPASSLILGGANAGLGAASFDALTMNGRNASPSAQSFNDTTIVIGPAVIRANSGAGSTAQLALGALGNTPGGIVNLITPTATGGAGGITTTTPNLNGILGGWATVGNGGAFNNITMGTEWASVDGSGNIVPYTGYQIYKTGENLRSVANAASNIRINGTSTGDVLVDAPDAGSMTDVNTLNLSETRALSLVIGNGNTLRLGRFGSIFKSDNANNITWALGSGTTGGANGVQDQGTLTAGGAPNTPGEIVFYMNNGTSQSQGSLNVEAKVTDNGSGAVTLVKAGPASMKLRGHNTHSGGLILLQGRLQLAGSEIGTGNPDGAGTGPVHVYPGAYVYPSGTGDFGTTGLAISNNFFIAGLGTQQEQVGAIRFGNGTRIAGDVILTGDSRLGGGNATTLPNTGISGKITGPFSLDVGALGTINTHLSLFNPANDWTGTTTLNARNTATANNFRNGASDVIPHGVGKGNVVMNGNTSTGTITWDLNGFNETINGLLSSGNLAGCVILNNVSATVSTLTVGDYDQTASYGGSIQNGGGGSGVVALTKIGGGRQTLTGVNTYTGPTTVNGGTLAISGAGSIAASQQILVNGGTLDVSEVTTGFTYAFPVSITDGTLVVQSTTAPGIASLSMANSRLRVTSLGATPVTMETSGLLTDGQTNWIDISSIGSVGGYPVQFTIIKYGGTIGGVGFNFGLGAVPTASTIGYVSNNLANSSVDVVLLDGPKALTWTGAAGPAWDINNTVNWLAFGATPSVYLDVDSVRFDDGATLNTVNLTTGLQPGSVLVNNSLADFTFTGSGRISGPARLTKEGTARLVFDNSGTNDFFGPLTISAGTVQVGNQNAQGTLGAGAVVNNGALVFARSDAVTTGNPIAGAGTLTQNGTGILTLSGDSTFTGPTVVASGTVRAGSARAFGTIDGATIVNAGTTLDVNGQNLGAEPVTVAGAGSAGNGAIVNNGGAQLNALRAVTLAGDTTFGGTARWDIRQADGSATLMTGGAAYKITKIGSNQVSLVGLTAVDSALGDIEIQEGIFSVQTSTVQMGDPSRTVTVHSGATLGFFNLNPSPLNKVILLRDGAVVFNESGNSGISGPVEMQGNSTFNVANAATLTISSDLGGAGSLTKIGAGALVLNGPFNDYSGPTTVSNGTLFVNGSLMNPSSLAVLGGTLAGDGNIAGVITIGPNGNLAPGDAPGAISSIELEGSVSLTGTCTIDINKSLVVASDVVAFVNNLSLGGTLRLNVTGPALVPGDAFFIFGFTTANGAFNRIEPASPGPGLAWDTSTLTVDGMLRVSQPAPPGIANISFTEDGIVWNGTNGIAGTSYVVLSSTDITLPVANWTPVATNYFDLNGQFRITNAINSNLSRQFFLLRLP